MSGHEKVIGDGPMALDSMGMHLHGRCRAVFAWRG
jgi:hypothetical protein